MNAPRALLLALAGWSSLAAAGAQAGGTAADTQTARGACLDVSMACTAKLTPDTTGLGGAEQFVQAMGNGKHVGAG
jgi:hypothetical protein